MTELRLDNFVTLSSLRDTSVKSTDFGEASASIPAVKTLVPEHAYRRTAPAYVNRSAIPENYLQLFDAQWNMPEQQVEAIHGYRFRNVLVDLDGIVIDSQDRLFRETVAECDLSQRFHLEFPALRQTVPGEVRAWKEPLLPTESIPGPALLLKKAGFMNYGHWLIEMLPRVQFRGQLGDPDLPVLVHRHSGVMRDRVRESLLLAGVRETSIVEFETPARVDDLYWVSPVSRHNHMKSPVIGTFLSGMADKVAPPSVRSGNRMFLSRTRCHIRRVVNEDALFSIAADHGFRRVYTEDLTLTEQIRLFRSAEAVIAPLGAALTNIVFSPSETRVMILQPAKSLEFFFWDIACHRGQRYVSIHGQSVGDTVLDHYHGDYSVDLTDFRLGITHLFA